jgi:hypothetical protein
MIPPKGGTPNAANLRFRPKALFQTRQDFELFPKRTLILLRPSILSQLNKVKRDREEKQDVNRAALMQDKLQHKPDN